MTNGDKSCYKKMIEFTKMKKQITRKELYKLLPEYKHHTIRSKLSQLKWEGKLKEVIIINEDKSEHKRSKFFEGKK